MAKSLQEYAEWLDERELVFPAPPKFVSAGATPFLKPMKGIRGVVWSIYGTLLRVSDGELVFVHPDTHQMQVALDKTVQEFNMWNSMHRTPIPPWEQLSERYNLLITEHQMAGTPKKGEFAEVDSSRVWRKLLRQLGEKEYGYDMEFYGDPEEFSDKVAYFFHANCQGVEASANALNALVAVTGANLPQGLLADAQPFTLVQMLRALKEQGTLPPLASLFSLDCLTLSFQEGVRKPSKSLYMNCLEQFDGRGVQPQEMLYVTNRLNDDLAIAKQVGMRTALYAGDKTSLRASKSEMKNPEMKPDRLLTDLAQIRDILSIA